MPEGKSRVVEIGNEQQGKEARKTAPRTGGGVRAVFLGVRAETAHITPEPRTTKNPTYKAQEWSSHAAGSRAPASGEKNSKKKVT